MRKNAHRFFYTVHVNEHWSYEREDKNMKDYFEEIKGYEEVKAELRVISDMLVNPEIYKNMGSGINEGLLIY